MQRKYCLSIALLRSTQLNTTKPKPNAIEIQRKKFESFRQYMNIDFV